MRHASHSHRFTTPAVALALVIGLALPTGATAQGSRMTAAEQDAAFTVAASEFRSRHFAGAYGRFIYLADHGNAEAARIARVMYGNGMALFGTDWYASPQQLNQWAALVVNDARGSSALTSASD